MKAYTNNKKVLFTDDSNIEAVLKADYPVVALALWRGYLFR